MAVGGLETGGEGVGGRSVHHGGQASVGGSVLLPSSRVWRGLNVLVLARDALSEGATWFESNRHMAQNAMV